MKLSRERKGETFIFAESTLWALFPVITILSFTNLSPLISLAGSIVFATIFFAAVLTIKKKWYELKNTSALGDILLATFFIGILFHLLYFFGLQKTSAGNASIIALTEIFFSYLFFHVFRKDYIPKEHIVGAVLMIIGAFIVLYPNLQGFKGGELLIMAGAFIAPFGNFFQQRARKKVSSETMMFIRSLISSIFIFFLILILKAPFSFPEIKNSLPLLLINGIFMLGLSKILWIEGIHRISVTKANALNSMSPLLTLLFAWVFLKDSPTIWQFLSFIPMFFGIILLGVKKNDHSANQL